MSDWQVGDDALCVETGDLPGINGCGICYIQEGELQRGKIYSVLWVGISSLDGGAVLDVGGAVPFDVRRFRKIRPDEHAPCEEEFRILLKLSKRRVKTGEPA